MCGIIAGLSLTSGLGAHIWSGLCRLEYRGYDSFGLAYRPRGQPWKEIKYLGAPSEWKQSALLEGDFSCGIGHTRWATHGAVSLKNAHPHYWNVGSDVLSLVHNGVIENLTHWSTLLTAEFQAQLQSETDSEQILALIAQYIATGMDVASAITMTISHIEGSFAIILMELNSDRLWAIRKNLPLYCSQGKGEHLYVVSDLVAFPNDITTAYALKDLELISASLTGLMCHATGLSPQETLSVAPGLRADVNKEPGSHLEREIFEQEKLLPILLAREQQEWPAAFEEIHFIGCGSSFYAAQFCAQMFSSLAGYPTIAFIASEFRDWPPLVTRPTLLIALSQSGETADVLGALRDHGSRYCYKLALCNRPGAMIEELVDRTYPVEAGPEYSVASTKAFTAQIIQLMRFIPHAFEAHSLSATHNALFDILHSPVWAQWAKAFVEAQSILILARGLLLPIAQEGALKLRELTYKQTQAIASGELKHGSLALIDSSSMVILCAPCDRSLTKHFLAAQEIHARGGKLWVLLQEGIDPESLPRGTKYVVLPAGQSIETALYFTLPFQLLALHLSKVLGNNVDRPRNLAKSVTVE